MPSFRDDFDDDREGSQDGSSENDQDEAMKDAEEEDDAEGEAEPEGDDQSDSSHGSDTHNERRPGPTRARSRSTSGANGHHSTRPLPLAETLTAATYDIVPTVAAPHSTSINAIAATPDMRWVFTGGADGYIRKFNWTDTINGKVMLTVAQRHPFVDSVTKAGVLMSYWDNEDEHSKLNTQPALPGLILDADYNSGIQ